MTGKFDITSSVLEKGIEIAKEFLDRLVAPATEEVGLLMRDTVAFWKFKNQVRVLTKAKAYCESNGISPGTISLKLLCPLLENAALEEDDNLQDKWAVLLSNLADSEQNIQNHVFPYILSQISANEFAYIERVYFDKKLRVETLTKELEQFRTDLPLLEKELQARLADVSERIEQAQARTNERFSPDIWNLYREKRVVEGELASLKWKETSLISRIAAPQQLPEDGLREYEVSNIVRLGLARAVQETYANSQTLEIPLERGESYATVDLEVELESDRQHLLTELGELFLAACTEKRMQ